MFQDVVEIDGAMGEGGGQIIRSSLALSLITGKAFTVTSIRARRKKPGLLRQHLTAVKAAAEVGGEKSKVPSSDLCH
jgi:RNA 3'-terminal phosphate cyclase (ATP)